MNTVRENSTSFLAEVRKAIRDRDAQMAIALLGDSRVEDLIPVFRAKLETLAREGIPVVQGCSGLVRAIVVSFGPRLESALTSSNGTPAYSNSNPEYSAPRAPITPRSMENRFWDGTARVSVQERARKGTRRQ